MGIERSHVVSAFRCVRRGRRVESASWIEARRVSFSWAEGEKSSSLSSEGEKAPLACSEGLILILGDGGVDLQVV